MVNPNQPFLEQPIPLSLRSTLRSFGSLVFLDSCLGSRLAFWIHCQTEWHLACFTRLQLIQRHRTATVAILLACLQTRVSFLHCPICVNFVHKLLTAHGVEPLIPELVSSWEGNRLLCSYIMRPAFQHSQFTALISRPAPLRDKALICRTSLPRKRCNSISISFSVLAAFPTMLSRAKSGTHHSCQRVAVHVLPRHATAYCLRRQTVHKGGARCLLPMVL